MLSGRPAASRVVGRYLLADEIASGGMATVHLGRLLGPVGFSRTVAIKRLHPQFAKDPDFVAMFVDEARIAARIRHPNVVPTLDVVAEGDEMLLVMEYVHGEAVSRLIRSCREATGRGVPVEVALGIIAAALHGLHAAHEAKDDYGAPLGIVHRDVSPQNILVGPDGTARVVDFGVAKASGRLQATREGVLKGKLAYMSPEQVASSDVDRRTDIYAASVVLWEMLTAKRLFAADSEVHVMQAVLAGAVRPPSHVAPGIPPAVDALVLRGLARDPALRFATAWEMAEAAQRLTRTSAGLVGAWVDEVGGRALAARAARIAELESRSAGGAQLAPAAARPSPATARETLTTVRESVTSARPTVEAPTRWRPTPVADGALGAESPSQASSVNVASALRGPATQAAGARPHLATGIVVALSAFALGGVIALRTAAALRGGAAAPAAADPSASSATAITPSPQAVKAPPEAASPPPSESASPASSAAASAPAAPSAAAAAPATAASAAPPKASPGATRAGSSCNPPYTVDRRGVRVPKMECL